MAFFTFCLYTCTRFCWLDVKFIVYCVFSTVWPCLVLLVIPSKEAPPQSCDSSRPINTLGVKKKTKRSDASIDVLQHQWKLLERFQNLCRFFLVNMEKRMEMKMLRCEEILTATYLSTRKSCNMCQPIILRATCQIMRWLPDLVPQLVLWKKNSFVLGLWTISIQHESMNDLTRWNSCILGVKDNL